MTGEAPQQPYERAECEFDPVPFDAEAPRIYGRVSAAAVTAGRKPRRRIAGVMIAATAIAEAQLMAATTRPVFQADHEGSIPFASPTDLGSIMYKSLACRCVSCETFIHDHD
jgi:hypothetical protein